MSVATFVRTKSPPVVVPLGLALLQLISQAEQEMSRFLRGRQSWGIGEMSSRFEPTE
jgi:hypothetical protein